MSCLQGAWRRNIRFRGDRTDASRIARNRTGSALPFLALPFLDATMRSRDFRLPEPSVPGNSATRIESAFRIFPDRTGNRHAKRTCFIIDSRRAIRDRFVHVRRHFPSTPLRQRSVAARAVMTRRPEPRSDRVPNRPAAPFPHRRIPAGSTGESTSPPMTTGFRPGPFPDRRARAKRTQLDGQSSPSEAPASLTVRTGCAPAAESCRRDRRIAPLRETVPIRCGSGPSFALSSARIPRIFAPCRRS